MADTKISALTSASTLTGVEAAPVVQSAATVKATVQDIARAQNVFTMAAAGTLDGTEPIAVHKGGVLKQSTTQDVARQLHIETMSSPGSVAANDYVAIVQGTTLYGTTVGALVAAGLGYKSLIALITQTGTGNPTLTIFGNTLGGTPVATRTFAGVYAITLAGAFPANKVWVNPRVEIPAGQDTFGSTLITVGRSSDDVIGITTQVGGSGTDALLTNFPFEIKVFP